MESKENSNLAKKKSSSEGYPMCAWVFKMQHSSNSARFHWVLLHILGYQWNETHSALSLLQLSYTRSFIMGSLNSSAPHSIQKWCKTPEAERVWVTESLSKYHTVTVSMTRYQQWVPSARLRRKNSPKPHPPPCGPLTCVIGYNIQLCGGRGGPEPL